MAITITNTPKVYTPSENPVIWQVSTSAPTLVYFTVDLLAVPTDTLINTFDIYPTPLHPTISYIDLSRILRSYVKWQAEPDMSTLAVPVTDPLFSYRLVISEILYDSSTGIYSTGAVYDNGSDKYFVWNALMDRIDFKAYLQNDFVINATVASRFLTNKPNYVNVNTESSELLYFLQNGYTTLNIKVKTYGSAGLINTYTSSITGLSTHNMYRIHASPKALDAILSVDFTNVTYYTIQLFDGSSVARTELRTYNLVEAEPYFSFANIWFSNSLGGFDTFQFTNQQKSIATKKVNIKKNIYGFDDSNVRSDNRNGIYNSSIENINTVTTTNFKAVSRPLTDLEADWLVELFQSRQAYLELPDGMLAPITITETSYAVMLNKYNRSKPNWIDIQYTLTDNISPSI